MLSDCRVLVPSDASSSAALIVTVTLRAAVWTWFIISALSGATMPSLESMVRARWSAVLAGTPGLHAAFSFESVADEFCYMLGPATVTVLATGVTASAGVAACVVLCVAGTVWFAAQRSTEPPPVPSAAPAPRRGRLAAPGLGVLIPAYACLRHRRAPLRVAELAVTAVAPVRDHTGDDGGRGRHALDTAEPDHAELRGLPVRAHDRADADHRLQHRHPTAPRTRCQGTRSSPITLPSEGNCFAGCSVSYGR